MIGYVKHFGSNKTMYFKIKNNRLLKKYTKICERVSILMNIEFDSEPIYGDNDKYIKAKVNTNFQDKKITKENASYKCLSLIMLDSVIRVIKKYYPQILQEECKYETKKTEMENLISDVKIYAHLIMNQIVNLIMRLIVNLIMDNLLRIKTVD